MLMNRIVPTLILIFISTYLLYSQSAKNEISNWYFGNRCGVSFTSGSPTLLSGNTTDVFEGTLTVSDNLGNFIFFSDGRRVYDKNWNIMPNGTGLKGNSSSTINVIPVKLPGAEHLYYFFTAGIAYNFPSDNEIYPHLEYGIINMKKNNGLGEVVLKNQLLELEVTEKMLVVYVDCETRWLVIRKDTDTFLSYKFDRNGFNTTPVTSTFSGGLDNDCPTCRRGSIALSSDGTKIAVANHMEESIELFNFNQQTGQITRILDFEVRNSFSNYGVEFSPNDTYLYVSDLNRIYQFDISTYDSQEIEGSQVTIFQTLGFSRKTYDIKKGIDDKIYFGFANPLDRLVVINNPNEAASELDINTNGLVLNGNFNQSFTSTPYFLGDFTEREADFDVQLENIGGCNAASTVLSASSDNDDLTYTWETPAGDIVEGQFLEIGELEKQEEGTYKVSIFNYRTCEIGEKEIVVDFEEIDLESFTERICPGDSVELFTSIQFKKYEWYIQTDEENEIFEKISENESVFVKEEGVYRVVVTTNDDCELDTTIVVFEYPEPYAEIRQDQIIKCVEDTVNLIAEEDPNFPTYQWSTGEKDTRFIEVTEPGEYILSVSNREGCVKYDTVLVINAEILDFEIEAELEFICEGDDVDLTATDGFKTYAWSNGDSSRIITIEKPGVYSVVATDFNDCEYYADIEISPIETIPTDIEILQSGTFCNGDEVAFQAIPIGDFDYLWSTGETTSSIVVTESGEYSVRVSKGETCKGESSISINFKDFILPEIIATKSAFCIGDSTTLIVNSEYDSYEWSTGETSRFIIVKESGEYSVSVRQGECRDTAYFEVKVAGDLPVTILADSTSNCSGEPIQLTAEPTGEEFTYLWSTGETSASIMATQSGEYSVTVSQNGSSCQGISSIDIQINAIEKPEITANKLILCGDDEAVLSINSNYSIIQWSNGEITNSITVTEEGTYVVYVEDEIGCYASDTISISKVDDIIAEIISSSEAPYCEGQPVILHAYPKDAENYIWSTGEKADSIIVTSSGRYTVEVFAGACSDVAEFDIQFTPVPPVSIQADKLALCGGETAELIAVGNHENYIWSTGDTASSITISRAGLYSVRGINGGICESSDEIFIEPLETVIELSNYAEIDLDSLHIGENSNYQLEISNLSGRVIKGYLEYEFDNAEIIINPNIIEIQDQSNENIQINYNRMTPQKIDKILAIVIDEPCEERYEFDIKGVAFANTKFSTIDTTIEAGEYLCIPIFGSIERENSPNLSDRIIFTIEFDATLFGMQEITIGEIISDRIIDNKRVLEIAINIDELNTDSEIITAMCGFSLIGELNSTIIDLSSNWENELIFSSNNPGSISLLHCAYDISRMTLYSPTELSIMPNPANELISAKLTTENKGLIQLRLIDQEGKTIYEQTINSQENTTEYHLQIDASQISSGTYFLQVITEESTISKPIVISK